MSGTQHKPTIITIDKAKELILGSDNKLFRVDFIKDTGEPRTMVCRFGVNKGKAEVPGVNHHEDIAEYITVYEPGVGFRTVNLNTVYGLKTKGVTYRIPLSPVNRGKLTPENSAKIPKIGEVKEPEPEYVEAPAIITGETQLSGTVGKERKIGFIDKVFIWFSGMFK